MSNPPPSATETTGLTSEDSPPDSTLVASASSPMNRRGSCGRLGPLHYFFLLDAIFGLLLYAPSFTWFMSCDYQWQTFLGLSSSYQCRDSEIFMVNMVAFLGTFLSLAQALLALQPIVWPASFFLVATTPDGDGNQQQQKIFLLSKPFWTGYSVLHWLLVGSMTLYQIHCPFLGGGEEEEQQSRMGQQVVFVITTFVIFLICWWIHNDQALLLQQHQRTE